MKDDAWRHWDNYEEKKYIGHQECSRPTKHKTQKQAAKQDRWFVAAIQYFSG